MKIQSYIYPKSSFLSIEKDMGIIIDRLLKNERLKKMLYYTTKDCLDREKLTEDQTYDLFGEQIRITPKIEVDGSIRNYIVISFDKFIPSMTNPEFRNNIIEFDVICHLDQWHMKDFQLRPFRIAAEIDTMFNNQRLTGIGKLEFVGATYQEVAGDYVGLCLLYQATHGEEDKKNMPNPADDEAYEANFDAIFNN